MKVLHLTLKKKWFDLIASGEKIEEYREYKPYWDSRLTSFTEFLPIQKPQISLSFIHFDEIHFRNGYNPDSPFMRVIHLGTKIAKRNGVKIFVIKLGKILEIKYEERITS